MRRNNQTPDRGQWLCGVVLAIGCFTGPLFGQQATDRPEFAVDQAISTGTAAGYEVDFEKDSRVDLTLGNFFTVGWNEDFTRRSSEGRAPDLALLRVQTNFMEREFRLNF